jgi:Arc/MetJ family transcription regulator
VATTKVKATFSIRRDLLEAVATAVAQGAAPSKNALVERALRHELRELRRRALAAQWTQAAKDPLFLRDVQESQEAFSSVDAETDDLIR